LDTTEVTYLTYRLRGQVERKALVLEWGWEEGTKGKMPTVDRP